MDRVFCFKNCPSKFCISACPSGALVVKENKVVVEPNRCYGCGLCRHMCMTWNVVWNVLGSQENRLALVAVP